MKKHSAGVAEGEGAQQLVDGLQAPPTEDWAAPAPALDPESVRS